MATKTAVPSFDADFISLEVATDPYPVYTELRGLGPVVWLESLGMYAVTRDVLAREVLSNPAIYSSAKGVSTNPGLNEQSGGAMLITTDGAQHRELREVFRKPLRPKALQEITGRLTEEATSLVDRLTGSGTFEGVNDFACHLPLTIVSRLIGVPEEGREHLLDWGTAFIEMAGGDNDRGRAAAPRAMEMIQWATENITPERVSKGGWAHQLIEAHEAGGLDQEWIVRLTIDYIIAGLDTTISATSSLLYQLGRHPEQWNLLRENPGLIQSAIGEAVRLESPLQAMSRVTTRDVELGGVELAEGSRVVVIFGCVNRDEERWERADQFDITRPDATEHLAFGLGEHACVGQGLAKHEIQTLLKAMIPTVSEIEVDEPAWHPLNGARVLSSLPTRFN
ncbi:hypothetical protein AOA12_16380 [Microbacterium sp. No. 7]|nr:hypothetical protein AOA12_16380 [Microbacterium sp. No. 7]